MRRHRDHARHLALPGAAALVAFALAAQLVLADVPGGRPGPKGTVPNPGTQEQELTNITLPAPYNVFEFVVTCGACHGGTIDQEAGHFGNWAGTAMASAARDPIFRANNLLVNNTVKDLTGNDGAGNMCFRCHSPNGWYSGRFDPQLGGRADGSGMIHSILLSTDDEGVLCEACHRTMGAVTMKRADLDAADPVWNMLEGIDDWPHQGLPYPDGPVAGLPYGDTTLQLNDGMTYTGKYSGSVDFYFLDTPLAGTLYTGQTYAVWPPGTLDALGNDIGGTPVVNADGSVAPWFELPIGPPLNPNGTPDYQAQAISLEHPTQGGPNMAVAHATGDAAFLQSSEFCGTCHELTIPVLNSGMPEQRTYSEWYYSSYGREPAAGAAATPMRCQDCHMPLMKHEYTDDARVSLNPDPQLAGFFPYGKNRNPDGGTAFHKFAGANRWLPPMMKTLYPEVDLEVIGAPTGRDTRVFPGMMSDRALTWDRATRNNELSLARAADLEIVSGPSCSTGTCTVQVKVTNNAGHRIPSGYPDGRRAWVSLVVTDAADPANPAVVYESGHYDRGTATLTNSAADPALTRALGPAISADNNAVMIYEKRTGSVAGDAPAGHYTITPSLLNDTVVFDNRIPPAGFDVDRYAAAGVHFVTYTANDDGTVTPVDDPGRFLHSDGGPATYDNYDLITYSFPAPPDTSALTARAELHWQVHSREFVTFLVDGYTGLSSTGPRPEGPPSVFEPNYPLTLNYLSDHVDLAAVTSLAQADGILGEGQTLNDDWAGIAFAAWYLNGKGEPFLTAADGSDVAGAPAAPDVVTAENVAADPATGATTDPFSLLVRWSAVAGADSYIVWVRYGIDSSAPTDPLSTASWDQLALVPATLDATEETFLHDGLNVAKTYQYRVQAVDGKGASAFNASPTAVARTPWDLPLPPEWIQVQSVTTADPAEITLTWYDAADNEDGFIVQRQDVPAQGDFYTVATVPTNDQAGFGGHTTYTDSVPAGSVFNYRVAAYNANGWSTFTLPVQAATLGVPLKPTLAATATGPQSVTLTWLANGTIEFYTLERSGAGAAGPFDVTRVINDPQASSFVDTLLVANTDYWYRLQACNTVGCSTFSDVAAVTTQPAPPVAVGDGPYATDEDAPLSVPAPGLLGNDSDPASLPITAALASDPAHGSAVVNADGSFTYTPAANYNGPDTFTYTATNGTTTSAPASVALTVAPVNDAPVATADTYSTPEDTPLVVAAPGALTNDTDIDGDPLTAALVTGPAHGTLGLNADGSFTYTPEADYNGPDAFTYTANDAALSSVPVAVGLTVTAVNDAPVAADDTHTGAMGLVLGVAAPGVLANDTDIDGDPVTASLVDAPVHGILVLGADGSFTYTPASPVFTGTDTFTYTAGDGALSSAPATVTITLANWQTFNADALTDLMWRNGSTGGNYAWFMDGSTRIGSANAGIVSNTAWVVEGAGDFNADGSADLVWRNTSTGSVVLWTMNGVTQTGFAALGVVSNTEWRIRSVADINNDGHPDLVWRNVATGANVVWYYEGTTNTGMGLLPPQPAGWELGGAGDFNADGHNDLVWRNPATGVNEVWLMNGVSRLGVTPLDTRPGSAWAIEAVGDYSKDGGPDLVWRNTATGQNEFWIMDGTATVETRPLFTVSNLAWSLVAPR